MFIPLRDENFEFPDLLGAAYEYLIKYFADSAGKKAGEFYTPADVVRVVVEILDPQPGMSVYDPTVGSGGSLSRLLHSPWQRTNLTARSLFCPKGRGAVH